MSRTRSFVAGAVASLMLLVLSVSPPAFGAFHLEYVEDAVRADFVGQPRSTTPQAPISTAWEIDGNEPSGTGKPRTPETRSESPRSREPYSQGWGSVEQRIAAAWPGDDSWALRVVDCESDFNPEAGGPGSHSHLWQFGSWAKANYGNPAGKTVEEQTADAWALYQDYGKSQWECS